MDSHRNVKIKRKEFSVDAALKASSPLSLLLHSKVNSADHFQDPWVTEKTLYPSNLCGIL